ncbi:hypothetical protein HT031_005781 [Scenedesmus sp. PABB004]|nr:hypothetical protein HT031_005781 [Scenedesmus sp. PABB004]
MLGHAACSTAAPRHKPLAGSAAPQGCAPPLLRRAVQARLSSKQQQQLAAAAEEEQAAAGEAPGAFQQLFDRLLNRASSSLKRGPATCLTCKGQGSCQCPACKGQGLLDKDHARMNVMRHTAQKVKQVLNIDRSNYDTEWLVTNRCRRCRGYGNIACPTCGGLGVRSPGVKAPPE